MSGSDLDSELRRSAERTVESILGAARADAERLSSEADQRIAKRRSSVMGHKATEHRAEARAAVASERHAAGAFTFSPSTCSWASADSGTPRQARRLNRIVMLRLAISVIGCILIVCDLVSA